MKGVLAIHRPLVVVAKNGLQGSGSTRSANELMSYTGDAALDDDQAAKRGVTLLAESAGGERPLGAFGLSSKRSGSALIAR